MLACFSATQFDNLLFAGIENSENRGEAITVDLFYDRNYGGQRDLDQQISALNPAFDQGKLSPVLPNYLSGMRYMGESQRFSKLGRDLPRRPVDGFISAQDEIEIAEGADACRQDGGCGQGVGACEGCIAQEQRPIGSHGQGVFQTFPRLGRSHGYGGDRTAELLADAKGLLQGMAVDGVGDRSDSGPVDGARFRVQGDAVKLSRIGDLLYANNDIHKI